LTNTPTLMPLEHQIPNTPTKSPSSLPHHFVPSDANITTEHFAHSPPDCSTYPLSLVCSFLLPHLCPLLFSQNCSFCLSSTDPTLPPTPAPVAKSPTWQPTRPPTRSPTFSPLHPHRPPDCGSNKEDRWRLDLTLFLLMLIVMMANLPLSLSLNQFDNPACRSMLPRLLFEAQTENQ
jgi:hypothetical protein